MIGGNGGKGLIGGNGGNGLIGGRDKDRDRERVGVRG